VRRKEKEGRKFNHKRRIKTKVRKSFTAEGAESAEEREGGREEFLTG
jgi:hypothetical protein